MDELRIPGQTWDESGDLFEHQGHPLTVGALRQALAGVDDDVVVAVIVYDGSANRIALEPTEVGLTGGLGPPECLTITASHLAPDGR